MENIFGRADRKLGFGCLRLPMRGDEVDREAFSEMVDYFLENGFCYFDTARSYLDGKSETALRECLVERHPRESYIFVDKLTSSCFDSEEEIDPLFQRQLDDCGLEYFDFYLMHAQSAELFEKYKRCRAYEHALEYLKQGRIRHFGISFHDKAEVLEEILRAYPQIELVQLQFNYVDYDDASVQSRKCYELCRKYGKPVVVMEPVKGGCLARLPEPAQEVFDALGSASAASYAVRFAAGFEGVQMVLSGMGDMEMMRDNVSYMKDFAPLSERERAAVDRVREIFRAQDLIPCTACRYCVPECPKKIPIPNLFACMNARKQFQQGNSSYYYDLHTASGGRASECVECGRCEKACPQHLKIRAHLKDVAKEFEK